jgi:hypothetical protein
MTLLSDLKRSLLARFAAERWVRQVVTIDAKATDLPRPIALSDLTVKVLLQESSTDPPNSWTVSLQVLAFVSI